jgi:FkbM family methyltransferase
MSAEGSIDLLVAQRFFDENRAGTMLEIGAARPDWLSIGAYFRDHGWDVLSVEPNPVFAQMHREEGHDVAEVALASEDLGKAPFTIVDCGGAVYRDGSVSFESWSSLGIKNRFAQMDIPRLRKIIDVRVCRANTLLGERRPAWREIDLLAVDVEGWELDVLQGLDFRRYRPKVLIVENLFLERSYHAFMRMRGYTLWALKFPNEVFVRRENLTVASRWLAALITAPQILGFRLRRFLADRLRGMRATLKGPARPSANSFTPDKHVLMLGQNSAPAD